MSMESDLSVVIDLVEEWNARGWGEHLLWEVLIGEREAPFPKWAGIAVSDQLLALLGRLQTEHKVWPMFAKGKWLSVPIDKWKNYAAAMSADKAREGLRGVQ